MAKNISWICKTKREDLALNLFNDSYKEGLEAIRAHFESHPALPGEKAIKDRVNEILNDPALLSDYDNGHYQEERNKLATAYAKTRIRETTLEYESISKRLGAFDLTHVHAYYLKGCETPVHVGKIDAELRRDDLGVGVYAANIYSDAEDKYQRIAYVPQSFLTNNPMNVDKCKAVISIEDFSYGQLKNISKRLVVDSDLMSGDILELRDDMLNSLEQNTGMEQ